MKSLTVRFDDDGLEDLRELAHQRKTTMAALVRYALDVTFEDELDLVAADRALEEAARHPDDVMTLQEYMRQRELTVDHCALIERFDWPNPDSPASRTCSEGGRAAFDGHLEVS